MNTPDCKRRVATGLAGVALTVIMAGAAPASLAQPTAKPALPATAPAADYEIHGFRSAVFGMTQAQVRSAIAADFGAGSVISPNADPIEGTQALQTTVAHLDPGPGAAQVTYIFGATSKTLAHVNVVWVLTGEPTAEQRASIVTAAIQLADYFQTMPSPPKATAGATPTGPNGLLLFAAVDKKGAGVEVAADGISFQATQDNKPITSPTPKGPATLRVSYIANVTKPDIFKLKPGAF